MNSYLKLGLVSIIICLPAIWPFFNSQFFPLHDYTHVARLSEMVTALNDGHFPVRWSRNLGYGYGMPQFNFYGPLFYYLAAGFHFFGVSLLWSVKLSVILNYLVSFLAIFWLTSRLSNRKLGILAATLFIYAPYRAVDTYVRGAFAELTAITFVALCLTMIVYWYKDKKSKYAIYLALSVAGLMLSHNLVALMAIPCLSLIVLVYFVLYKDKNMKKNQAILGLLVGLLMAGFYWIPVLAEKQFTTVNQLTAGFSDYHHHFLYLRQLWDSPWAYGGSIGGLSDDMSFEIGKWLLILGGLGGVGMVFYRTDRFKQILGLTLLIITGGVILLMTYKTQWLWEIIPVMAFIQFPWRFLSLTMVFLPILVVGLKGFMPKKQWLNSSLIMILVLGIVVSNVSKFKPKNFLADNELLYYDDVLKIQSQMSGVIPDFIPNFGTNITINPPSIRFSFEPEPEEWQIEVDRTHEFAVKAKLNQATTFKANIFYFPGWELWLNGIKTNLKINREDGTFSTTLQATDEEVIISGRFGESLIRIGADWISIIAVLGLIYWWLPIKSGRLNED